MSIEYKEDTDDAQRRMEAWWNRDLIDRPTVAVAAPRGPGRGAAASTSITFTGRSFGTVGELSCAVGQNRAPTRSARERK